MQEQGGHEAARAPLLVVALELAQHARVDDRREDAQGVGAVQRSLVEHVLDEGLRDDDQRRGLRRVSDSLKEEIHHSLQVSVTALEELRHAEENALGIRTGEALALKYEIEQLRDLVAAPLRVHADKVGIVEDAAVLRAA